MHTKKPKDRLWSKQIRRGGQKGAVLISGLLITTILTLVAVNASKNTLVQQRMASNYRFSIEAMNNADIGSRNAINQINTQTLILNGFNDELDADGNGVFDDRFSITIADPTTNVFFDVVMIDDDDGDGNMSVDSNGIVLLVSQGISGVGSTRTTEVRIADTDGGPPVAVLIDAAIVTEEDLVIAGNPAQFGGHQDIHSNGDIDIAGSPSTSGVVSAVGVVTVSGAGSPTTQSGAAESQIPHIDPGIYAQYADYVFESDGMIYDSAGIFIANGAAAKWQGWKFLGDKWTTVGVNVQGGMLYFRGANGNVDIGGSPGNAGNPWEVSIIADGWINVAGTPTIANYMNPSDPPEVQAILFLSRSDILISGNVNQTFTGIIAAGEQIEILGNASIEGILIAAGESSDSDLVTDNLVSGNMNITYDGGLALLAVEGAGDGIAVLLSWRDREIARDTGVFAY